MIGRRIKNRYYLLERLGGGGEGTVYLAKDEELGKYWAVKQLPSDRREEMQVLRKLSHSMLPQIVDYIQEDGCSYLVMEYIQGETLANVCRRKKCSRKQVILWGIQLCQVLEYLHTRYPAVIHMDVKPANILLTDQGELYLIDFGSCILVGENSGSRRKRRGTLGYAAPEQENGEVSCTCDIYGLGKTMETLIGGRMRAGGDFWKIIKKCLKADRRKRYHSCRDLGKELRKLTEKKRHRFFLWFILLGLTGGVLAGKALFLRTEKGRDEVENTEIQENFLESYTKIQNQIQKGMRMEEGQARRLILRQSEKNLKGLMDKANDRERIFLHLALARIYREQKDSQAAGRHYQWLLEQEWEVGRVSFEYGIYLLETGEREQSQELYEQVSSVDDILPAELARIWKEDLYEQ